MRTKDHQGSLTVQAIAGTYVVLFGMSLDAAALDGLLGFSIERLDHSTGQRAYLDNFLLFQQNDTAAEPDHSSEHNPFQAWVWGDYTPKPEREYTYFVSSRYGTPSDLRTADTVELHITTEPVSAGTHTVVFNRGAATSQAYALRFPGQSGEHPQDDALAWLSRGLEEELLAFIGQAGGAAPDGAKSNGITAEGAAAEGAKGDGTTADGVKWGLRAAIYELQYEPVLKAFAQAAQSGADVQIVFDDIDNSEPASGNRSAKAAEPATRNADAIAKAGIAKLCRPRRNSSYIAHNKFIVLLKDGEPQQVLTGSTNITAGGIFGHSNVAHVVRDPQIAARYLDYWNELARDPALDPLRDWTTADEQPPEMTPEELLGLSDPLPPDHAIGTVFSPRHGDKALQWYAKLMDRAQSSVFLTAAFGVSKELQTVFKEPKPYLRYLLLDNRKGRIDTIARGIEANPNNEVVAGAYIGERGGDGWHQWVAEHVTDFNHYVQFIHTKYMLIDALSDDPILISGSANFSDASTSENDENMLVIRGDTRVADIYLGEFMRLFSHFRLRGRANASPSQLLPVAGVPASQPTAEKLYLRADSSWTAPAYVSGSPEEKERLMFSGAGG